ncbi:tyrosine-protein phosphatase [Thalassococcus sp. BH17M4-6]|uniref:phosphatase domain-containing protein n=1 Tax=Thalassococcus sp. BH17M4-6 TaxID=3413148 RepID=UPI003BD8A083
MLMKLWTRIEDAERRLRRSFGKDIASPRGRFWAKLHYHVFDHAFLRVFWSNFFKVAPGVYRSNQPTHARFEKYAAMGIKTVINLRGEDNQAHYYFEKESAEALGLTLVNAKLWARTAAPRKRIVGVIDALRTAEKPLMFHCKSGADRAGFVAAMYLMVFENQPVEVAKKQLGLKYIHLDFTATGVQDYILDVYAARTARDPIGFEDWIRTEYHGSAMQAAYESKIPPALVDMSE